MGVILFGIYLYFCIRSTDKNIVQDIENILNN